MTYQPDYHDIATNARDALAFLEALNRADIEGVNAIIANCNGTALLEHMAGMVAQVLTSAGIPPLAWIAAIRAMLAEVGDDAINEMGKRE